jgi:hypothetical protein
MSGKAAFTKADVKRAVSGFIAAGVPIGRVIINPNGQIEVLPASATKAHDNDEWADLV